MRKSNSKHILLTGATGNLGAFTLRQFLDRGHQVTTIVRSRRSVQMATGRIVRSMSVFGTVDPDWLGRLKVIRADITERGEMGSLRVGGIDETWHFASSLKYMPKDREELVRVNISALPNILELHSRHTAADSRFFYVSTAYVGGRGSLRLPERAITVSDGFAFRNDYEKTKYEGEMLVLGWCQAKTIKGVVFRPSIVVADTKTNRMVHYTGYYLAVRLFKELQTHLKRIGSEETVRLFARPTNELNLIPLDEAVRLMMLLANCDLDNGSVFNIVNGVGVKIKQAVEIIGRALDMDIQACDPDEELSLPKNRYEKMIAYGMTYTAPYITDRIEFDNDQLTEKLGEQWRFQMYPDYLFRITKAYADSLDGNEDPLT